ncbi:carbon starvation protein A [Fundidesulfovibrio butyratiphilus]
MNALTLVFASLCIFAIAYRFYGLFLAKTVLGVKESRLTPAKKMADGVDYVETNKYVLFGHHFAAIAAAGPLIGPVLAAQWGYAPGALWILAGCVLAGAVHDTVVLFASVRHKGQSLAYIVTREVDKFTGGVASFAVLFILILTLAGLSIACVKAMQHSPWSTFTVLSTMPIAILMGLYLQFWRPGDVRGATIIGVSLLAVCIIAGRHLDAVPWLYDGLDLSEKSISIIIPVYGFFASVLPVWLLLCPRDYLSTYLKIGTIGILAVGIVLVHPDLRMPAVQFAGGGGPIIGGPLFPFLFITIACGAISGFHAIIATGTTPKMLDNEGNLLFVGYGAMLTEGFVAIMALIAACVMIPADYFAINASPTAYAALGMVPVELDQLTQAVGEATLVGRTGGAVSLAVGMAYIFSAVPGMEELMNYWYHFAIMFEAVFILTAVDAGTRVGRFFLQEMFGVVAPKFHEKRWWPGVIITSFLFTYAWGYLVYTGNIGTIWPLFGMSNQLLAAVGLIIGTTMIIRMGNARYAWLTAVPGFALVCTTAYAGFLQITTIYLPKQLYLLSFMAGLVLFLMALVIIGAVRRWVYLLHIHKTVQDPYGDNVLEVVAE